MVRVVVKVPFFRGIFVGGAIFSGRYSNLFATGGRGFDLFGVEDIFQVGKYWSNFLGLITVSTTF